MIGTYTRDCGCKLENYAHNGKLYERVLNRCVTCEAENAIEDAQYEEMMDWYFGVGQ